LKNLQAKKNKEKTHAEIFTGYEKRDEELRKTRRRPTLQELTKNKRSL